MTPREITKLVVVNVVAFSTTFTVGSVLKQNIQPKTKTQEVEIWVGSTAVGMAVGDAMSKKTAKFVDDLFDAIAGPAPK